MSKIDVILTAVLHTDKGALQPGETASLEERQAKRLAALGMVKLPGKAAKNGAERGRARAAKKAAGKFPGKAASSPEEGVLEGDAGLNADGGAGEKP